MELSYEDKKAIVDYGGEIKGKQSELKTYILESNNKVNEIRNSDLTVNSIPTDVENIGIWQVFQKEKHATFYIDSGDPRFFVLYTSDLAETTDDLYNKLIHSATNKFDHIWIPKDSMYKLTEVQGNQFRGFGLSFNDYFALGERDRTTDSLGLSATGKLSKDVLKVLSNEPNLKKTISFSKLRISRGNGEYFVTNELKYNGRLITTAGNSIDYHTSFVQLILEKYRDLIERVEENRIGIKQIEGRTLLEGQAIEFSLRRHIEELDHFIEVLLNPRSPFRLWGLKNNISQKMRKIVAIDLHTGDPMDLEITSDLIRVYLPKNTCGNTVLRLYVNLQRNFDAEIKLNEEKLSMEIH